MSVTILAENDAPSIMPDGSAAHGLARAGHLPPDLAQRSPGELGRLYAAGRAVPRDLVEAHKWLNIAALQGDRDAARQRQDIAGEMTRDEIARALAEARAWLALKTASAG